LNDINSIDDAHILPDALGFPRLDPFRLLGPAPWCGKHEGRLGGIKMERIFGAIGIDVVSLLLWLLVGP
jgi:hypothetical protein